MYLPIWLLNIFGLKCGRDVDHQFSDGEDRTSSDVMHYECKRCGSTATASHGHWPRVRD